MNEKIKVLKFGGSSMKDYECMKRSALISMEENANIVAVSATYGTTNLLVRLGPTAQNESFETCEVIINQIIEKHITIFNCLSDAEKKMSSPVLDDLYKQIITLAKGINLLKDCSKRAVDSLTGIGERLSSCLFTSVLRETMTDKKVELFDIANIMITNDNYGKAAPFIEKIKSLASHHLMACKHGEITYVTQGFVGRSTTGVNTTLGRGGSDYSAALIAEAINADELQIWTDVPGIATTDPRVVKSAKAIPEITFQEAAELATFGAKVLHPTTLTPAMRANIKVFIGNSYDSQSGGTWIKKECDSAPLVRAMTRRKGCNLLTIKTPKMLDTHGFLYEVFKIFNQYKVSVDSITTSEISIALTTTSEMLENEELLKELEMLGDIKVEENLSLISLIGNNINHTSGLGSRIFTSLGDINVRLICHGASKHNFCFLVREDLGDKAIKRLHHEFIDSVNL